MLPQHTFLAPPEGNILVDNVSSLHIPTSPKTNKLRERFKIADGVKNNLIQSKPSRGILTLPT